MQEDICLKYLICISVIHKVNLFLACKLCFLGTVVVRAFLHSPVMAPALPPIVAPPHAPSDRLRSPSHRPATQAPAAARALSDTRPMETVHCDGSLCTPLADNLPGQSSAGNLCRNSSALTASTDDYGNHDWPRTKPRCSS